MHIPYHSAVQIVECAQRFVQHFWIKARNASKKALTACASKLALASATLLSRLAATVTNRDRRAAAHTPGPRLRASLIGRSLTAPRGGRGAGRSLTP